MEVSYASVQALGGNTIAVPVPWEMFEPEEGNFNEAGFLQLGFAGHQPGLANYYTNNGSLYMTSLVFMPLALPAGHPFWTDAPQPWTSQKAWTGKDFPIDGHVSLKK